MALGFFRRNQKMVMIIMVVLMVSFLIGFQGLQSAFSPSQGGRTFATTRYGKLTWDEMNQAQYALHVVQMVPAMGDLPLRAIMNNGKEADVAFALLMQEANHMKVKVSTDEVNNYLEQLQLTGDAWTRLMQALREQRVTSTDDAVRGAIADWLKVCKMAQLAVYDVPPSEPELKVTFRDLTEKIDLCIATIPATQFMPSATSAPASAPTSAATSAPTSAPSEPEVEQFNKYRTVLAGTYTDINSFGFGYKVPNQAAISYLLLNQSVVERIVRQQLLRDDLPSADDPVLKYFRNNPNETVLAASEPASKLATQSTTAAADKPIEIEKPISAFGDRPRLARPGIVKKILPGQVQIKMDDMMNRVERALSEVQGNRPAGQGLYEAAVARMTLSADQYLAKPIKSTIQDMPLDKAMAVMAKEVGLQSIAYPWGQQGKESLEPTVKVTLKADGAMTLKQALDQITENLHWIKIEKWAFCQGIDEVLFPLPPADGNYPGFFPVYTHQTSLSDPKGLLADPLINGSSTAPSGGVPLIQQIFTAKAFVGTRQQDSDSVRDSQMDIASQGPLMYVRDDLSGKLLWTLTAAVPAHDTTLSDLQDNPKLREKVVHDLQLVAAMKQALAKAQQIKTAAQSQGLELAAKAAGIETVKTGLFTRRAPSQGGLDWNRVPKFDFVVADGPPSIRMAVNVEMINKAFSLAPAVVEPTTQDFGPSDVADLSLPPLKEVVLMQRVGYEPAVISIYQTARPGLFRDLMQIRAMANVVQWFNAQNIKMRMGYQK